MLRICGCRFVYGVGVRVRGTGYGRQGAEEIAPWWRMLLDAG